MGNQLTKSSQLSAIKSLNFYQHSHQSFPHSFPSRNCALNPISFSIRVISGYFHSLSLPLHLHFPPPLPPAFTFNPSFLSCLPHQNVSVLISPVQKTKENSLFLSHAASRITYSLHSHFLALTLHFAQLPFATKLLEWVVCPRCFSWFSSHLLAICSLSVSTTLLKLVLPSLSVWFLSLI